VSVSGTVESLELPAWVPDAGKFATVSTNTGDDANPCPPNNCVYSGTSGFQAIWTAWNGGAYAPTLGAYGSLLMFGGGHFSYHGNEVIAYDLDDRTFSALSSPSLQGPGYTTDWPAGASSEAGPDAVGAWNQYNDGTPYPVHTNCGSIFLPSAAGGGPLGSWVHNSHDQTGITSDVTCKLWRFDLSARTWSVSNSISNFASGNGGAQRAGMVYDSTRLGIWIQGFPTGGPSFYNWNTGAETAKINLRLIPDTGAFDANLSGNNVGTMVHHPARDFLLMQREDNSTIICVDLSSYVVGSSTTAPAHNITQSGTQPGNLYYDRLEYCDEDECLYLLDWTSKATAKLYKLTPPVGALTGTWTWTNETLTAQSGESLALMAVSGGRNASAALYGRFRWVPLCRSFIVSDGHTLPAQLFRPAAFT
jgi:hypothetical protein